MSFILSSTGKKYSLPERTEFAAGRPAVKISVMNAVKKRVPIKFWEYGMRWVCKTMSRTNLRAHRIDGGVPLKGIIGDTVDISNYLEFGFYNRVWFCDNADLAEPLPSCWLGVSKNVGSIMTYYVL
jgi:hypothetical protein